MHFLVRLFLLSLCLSFFAGLFAIAVTIRCDEHISRRTCRETHSDLAKVPTHKVALILGCSPTLHGGRKNLYFLHRINAAAEAWHAGKCRYLIVSGDNSRKSYNEPEAMKQALVEQGVPRDRIIEDFAGFRTLDSVVRAKKVFGQRKLLVISQSFHNERAIYIAQQNGMTLSGYNAAAVSFRGGWKTQVREKLARVKTLIDLHVTHEEPKFLGEPVPVGNSATVATNN